MDDLINLFDGKHPSGDRKENQSQFKTEAMSSPDVHQLLLSIRINQMADQVDQLVELSHLNALAIREMQDSSLEKAMEKTPVTSTPVMAGPTSRPTTATAAVPSKSPATNFVNKGQYNIQLLANSSKYLPTFDSGNIMSSIITYESLFEINEVDNDNDRYRILATALLKGKSKTLFEEFRECHRVCDRSYSKLREFLIRRGKPYCRAERYLDELDKNSRSFDESIRLAESLLTVDVETHTKMFLYREMCDKEPSNSNLRDYLRRFMSKPFDEFKAVCLLVKARTVERNSSTVSPRNFSTRVFTRTRASNQQNAPGVSRGETVNKKCYFHKKFDENAYLCYGGDCVLQNHDNVRKLVTSRVLSEDKLPSTENE